MRTFIEAQRVARLATVDECGAPHLVPICFALIGDTMYLAIDEKPKIEDYARLRRLRNIAANPRVQVLFDVYDDRDWKRLRYVQVRGAARIIGGRDSVSGGDEHARAIMALRERYVQYRSMALQSRPVIAIDVDGVVDWHGS